MLSCRCPLCELQAVAPGTLLILLQVANHPTNSLRPMLGEAPIGGLIIMRIRPRDWVRQQKSVITRHAFGITSEAETNTPRQTACCHASCQRVNQHALITHIDSAVPGDYFTHSKRISPLSCPMPVCTVDGWLAGTCEHPTPFYGSAWCSPLASLVGALPAAAVPGGLRSPGNWLKAIKGHPFSTLILWYQTS